MKQLCWLWMGLVIGLAAPAMGQPPAKARTKKAPAKGSRPADLAAADVAALSSASPEVAAKAAAALGANANPAAHEALLDALALGLPAAVAVPALAALAAHPAPPDVLALRRYASHVDAGVRSAALSALAMYPSPEAHAAIVAALHDPVADVRGAAAAAAARGRIRTAIEPLLKLLAKGEVTAARALGALADADLARTIADQLGKVPEATLALALGVILRRADVAEQLRVEVVHAIAKIQDPAAVTALTEYVDATPKLPARTSRQEAALVIQARVGGAK